MRRGLFFGILISIINMSPSAINYAFPDGNTIKDVNLPHKWGFSAKGRRIVSQPVIDERNVYFSSYRGYVYCLSKENGKELWKIYLFPKWFKLWFLIDAEIHSSPEIDNKYIYIGCYGHFINFSFNHMYCIEKLTGKIIWKKEFRGTAASAIVSEEKVYFSDINFVRCLNKVNGDEIWKCEIRTPLVTKAIIFENELIICPRGSVLAIDKNNGQKIWEFKLNKNESITGTPIIDDDTLFIGAWDCYLYRININDGSLIWSMKVDGVIDSPLEKTGNILICNTVNTIYCLNTETYDVVWKSSDYDLLEVKPIIYKNFVILTGARIAHDHGRKIVILNINDGKFVKKILIDSMINSKPVIDQKCLYYGTDAGKLIALDIETISSP